MQTIRSFETTVDVKDPINFCANKRRHMLAMLEEKFNGRCWGGFYIRKVVGISKTSSGGDAMGAVNICRTNTSGHGYVDVRFDADVAVFGAWDILIGAKRTAFNEMVICDYDREGKKAAITLVSSKATETISAGQMVPIRVIVAKHHPMQVRANVVGMLLTCDRDAPVYKLQGSLDKAATLRLAPFLDSIERELTLRAGLDPAAVSFHERNLYAYTDPGEARSIESWPDGPTWTGFGGAEGETNVLALVRGAARTPTPVSGFWSRPLGLCRSSPMACHGQPDHPAAVMITPEAMFAMFLKNILDYLICVREMAELYADDKSHANIWAVMRAAQRQRPV